MFPDYKLRKHSIPSQHLEDLKKRVKISNFSFLHGILGFYMCQFLLQLVAPISPFPFSKGNISTTIQKITNNYVHILYILYEKHLVFYCCCFLDKIIAKCVILF
jgi:hypothetical protein